jgi:hypothetical protein
MPAGTPLDDLRDIAADRARLDARELTALDNARRQGATWAEIAEALGVASRQAAEQRRQRLTAAAARRSRSRQQDLDISYGQRIVTLRTAIAALHRRIGADRRWDTRFVRATLVRDTVAAAVEAPPGSLFSLASDAAADLGDDAVPRLPGPLQAAVDALHRALAAATPLD